MLVFYVGVAVILAAAVRWWLVGTGVLDPPRAHDTRIHALTLIAIGSIPILFTLMTGKLLPMFLLSGVAVLGGGLWYFVTSEGVVDGPSRHDAMVNAALATGLAALLIIVVALARSARA